MMELCNILSYGQEKVIANLMSRHRRAQFLQDNEPKLSESVYDHGASIGSKDAEESKEIERIKYINRIMQRIK
jgi:hypothetical protein